MIVYALTILYQILIMSILMAVGFVLTKCGVITKTGTEQISTLLMKIIMPCMIVNAFARPFEQELFIQFVQAFALSLVAFGTPMLVARLFYKKDAEKSLSLVLSNNGFMAVPLLQALLGPIGVFLGSIHIVMGNVVTWSYGVSLHGEKGKSSTLKMLLFNPGTIALVLGFALFTLPITLPQPITEVIGYISATNTPLAMMLLGAYLTSLNFKKCFTNKSLILLTLVKLILVPLLLIGFYSVLPFAPIVCIAMFIGSATPTGMAAPMIAQYCKKDFTFSTSAVTFTTLISIITMPVMITLLQMAISL